MFGRIKTRKNALKVMGLPADWVYSDVEFRTRLIDMLESGPMSDRACRRMVQASDILWEEAGRPGRPPLL